MKNFVNKYNQENHRLSEDWVRELTYTKIVPMKDFWTYPTRNMKGQPISLPERIVNTQVKLYSVLAKPDIFYIKFYAAEWPAQLPKHPTATAPKQF